MAILSLNTVICRRRDYGSMDNSHVYWRELHTVHRTGRYYKVSDDTNSVTSPKLEFDTNLFAISYHLHTQKLTPVGLEYYEILCIW